MLLATRKEMLHFRSRLRTPKGIGNTSLAVEDTGSDNVYSIGQWRGTEPYLRSLALTELFSGWNYHYSGYPGSGWTFRWWRYARETDFQNHNYDNPYQDGAVKLQRFLFSHGCPEKAFIVAADPVQCGQGISLMLGEMRGLFDFALFENVSDETLSIRGVYGKSINNPACRSGPSGLEASSVSRLSNKVLIVRPGQRVLVALQMSFYTSSWKYDEALHVYNEIKSSPPGKIYNFGEVALAKEQFLPPRQRERSEFIYGPQWQIGALDVDGRRISLAKRSFNFLNLSIASPEASCPFLLVWNPVTEQWGEYGKVLHKAKSKSAEQAFTTTINGFRSKFRLAEREPETAHIDQAELSVKLMDGRTLSLTASDPRLTHRDGKYAVLQTGEELDFEFKLPGDVHDSEVTASELTIFGYYEPTSTAVRD